MKENKNPEIRHETLVYLLITAAVAAAVCFFTPAGAAGVLACGAALTGVHYYFAVRRYRTIAELSYSLDRILHGQEQALIEGSREGELAILTSEIQKMTLRLREQTDQLKRDKMQLTDAIADIFHQLRTPLTSMNLTAAMLREESLTYERRLQLTGDMRRQLERISWLVETLLKMSRIDSGTAVFTPEDMTAQQLIRRSAQAFMIPMELRGQELSVQAGDARLCVDPSWTAEALSNLLKNCMEHTPDGGRISVAAEETALYTQLTVEDSGEGFVPEDIPHLFERFYKGKNAAEGSIGIGLALSRMIVSAQDGTLTAENSPAGGARFIMRFYKSIV